MYDRVQVACCARTAGEYALSLGELGGRERLLGSPFTVQPLSEALLCDPRNQQSCCRIDWTYCWCLVYLLMRQHTHKKKVAGTQPSCNCRMLGGILSALGRKPSIGSSKGVSALLGAGALAAGGFGAGCQQLQSNRRWGGCRSMHLRRPGCQSHRRGHRQRTCRPSVIS